MIKDRNDAVGAQDFVKNIEYTEKKLNFIFNWFKSGFETPVSAVLAKKIIEDLDIPVIFERVENTIKNGNDGSVYYLLDRVLPFAENKIIEQLAHLIGPRIQKYSYFPIDLCCINLLTRTEADKDWLAEWLSFKESHCTERMDFIRQMKSNLNKNK